MNKVDIIPTLLTKNKTEALARLAELSAVSDWVSLDYADGSLTEGSTLALEDLLKAAKNFKKEVHLMVAKASRHFLTLAEHGVKRCVIHQESFNSETELKLAAAKLIELKITPVLSCWPENKQQIIKNVEQYQVMGVSPGASGQPFLKNTYQRVVNLKQQVEPSAMIALDGGVNPSRIKEYKGLVGRFAVGSFLQESGTKLKQQWRLLQRASQ